MYVRSDASKLSVVINVRKHTSKLKIQIFWNITPCRLVNSYSRLGGSQRFHPQSP